MSDNRLQKKYFGPDQIDGTKIKLLQGQSIRGTNSEGVEVELLKLDSEGKVQIIGSEVAYKSQLDAQKERIDAILDASDADKDSFAEIVALINSVDTENDTAFANYVLSNNASLAQEVSDRQAADAILQSNLDLEISARIAGDSSVTSAFQAADAILQSNLDLEISARIAGDSATLQEAKDYADLKDESLSQDIDALDVYAQDIRSDVDALDVYAQDIRSDLDSVDSRVATLEAKGFSKGMIVVGSELSFIDLDREYSMLLSVSVGRLAIHEGEDYTVSVVAGKTRLTFAGSLLSPDGNEAIEEGDRVYYSGAY